MHLDRVDLNLLPVLIALLEERHVSRAAARVGMTQPAGSRALARLRRTMDDELLVRTTGGYRLTPRAERILQQLTTVVPQLDSLFAGDDFSPASAVQSLHLAGSDYAVNAFGPALCRQIFAEAPGSTVRFHSWHSGIFDEVERGQVDLVFYGAQAPSWLSSEPLLTETFVCVVAADHPLAEQPALTLAEYLAAEHLVIDVENGAQPAVDGPLQKRGTPRRATLTLPYHDVATLALPGTRLVATLPTRTLRAHGGDHDVRVLAAPAEIETMHYCMAWHPGLNRDRSHLWLRSVVTAVVAGKRSNRAYE